MSGDGRLCLVTGLSGAGKSTALKVLEDLGYEAIDNLPEIVKVPGIDVLFIGSGDLSQSMGYPGQQTHPEVQAVMERGVKLIRDAGIVAGVSCPDDLVPKFLGLGVQYFHGNIGNFIHQAGSTYLKNLREAAAAQSM